VRSAKWKRDWYSLLENLRPLVIRRNYWAYLLLERELRRFEDTHLNLDSSLGYAKRNRGTTSAKSKDIIAEKTMSVNAQNVKIITIDGQVTLRGPVSTAEEKRLIGGIADRSAHSGDVDNQLEVPPTPVSDK